VIACMQAIPTLCLVHTLHPSCMRGGRSGFNARNQHPPPAAPARSPGSSTACCRRQRAQGLGRHSGTARWGGAGCTAALHLPPSAAVASAARPQVHMHGSPDTTPCGTCSTKGEIRACQCQQKMQASMAGICRSMQVWPQGNLPAPSPCFQQAHSQAELRLAAAVQWQWQRQSCRSGRHRCLDCLCPCRLCANSMRV
jgi:hypothetical protein